MQVLKEFFSHSKTQKTLILAGMGLFFYLTRSVFDLMFFTFIFSFLMYTGEKYFERKFKGKVPINPKVAVMLSVVFILFVFSYAFITLFPAVSQQVDAIVVQINLFNERESNNQIEATIKDVLTKTYATVTSDEGVKSIVSSVSEVGKTGLNVFLALVLSLFFMLERNRVLHFTEKFGTSKAASVYKEIVYFGKLFTRSFGTVIETQIAIAFINATLSLIALSIMGMPQVLGLYVMILVLGFIPVMGVIISLVPLCIIAYSTGGWMMVLAMVIMIIVLHALESYVLNPKLMSHKTELPVFYVFVILLASEHLFGVWGLIIGVPLFIFILELLGVDREEAPKVHKKDNKMVTAKK